MSKICALCDKSPTTGKRYRRRGMIKRKGGAGSKIVGKTLRKVMPNLQRVKIILSGTVKRTSVCTSCIRAGKIVKA